MLYSLHPCNISVVYVKYCWQAQRQGPQPTPALRNNGCQQRSANLATARKLIAIVLKCVKCFKELTRLKPVQFLLFLP